MQPNGDAVLLFADDALVKVTAAGSVPIDYHRMLGKDKGKLFKPRGVFTWGNEACLWGALRNKLTFLLLDSRKSWTVPIEVRHPGFNLTLRREDIQLFGAWNDTQVLYLVSFLEVRMIGKDGNVESWKPCVDLLRKYGLPEEILQEQR